PSLPRTSPGPQNSSARSLSSALSGRGVLRPLRDPSCVTERTFVPCRADFFCRIGHRTRWRATPWRARRPPLIVGGLDLVEGRGDPQGPGLAERPDDHEGAADHVVHRNGTTTGVVLVQAGVVGDRAVIPHEPQLVLTQLDRTEFGVTGHT